MFWDKKLLEIVDEEAAVSQYHVVLDENVAVNMSCVYIKEKIYELIIIILATLHR